MKKIKDAMDWIDIARMGYICDPNECGLEKGGDPCKVFHCDEIHDALVMAMEALKIADRLEQAITDEQTADCIIVDTECVNNKHDKEVWLNGYNQALSDLRGDKDGIEMRDATNQEKESVSAYIKSISEDTGFNFFR